MIAVLACAGLGLALIIATLVMHRREQDDALDDLLGLSALTFGGGDDESLSPLTDRAVDLAGQAVERMDRDRSLGNLLERAKVPLRPGEFVIILAGGSLGLAALALFLTGSLPLAAGAAIITVLLAAQVLRRRVAKRKRAFEEQLPDSLSLVASSLSAGHTFLRAVQMMCEESPPPLSEEFSRLVAETRLGDSVVEALERMAMRLQIRSLDMVVQAIRIQQTVGGRLADLFHTLADTIRSRDEVKREVQILTAEGRMSAYVLAGLVPFLFVMINMLNPDYVKPLYSGAGLIILVGCGVSVVAGLLVILRMVKIEV